MAQIKEFLNKETELSKVAKITGIRETTLQNWIEQWGLNNIE